MDRDLIATIKAFGVAFSFCAVVGAICSADLTVTLILAIIGVGLVAITLGEKNE